MLRAPTATTTLRMMTYSTQIRVKLHDEAHDLDHEAEGRNGLYEVVLKVTDDSDLEDTITVTIDGDGQERGPVDADGGRRRRGHDAGRKQRT